MLKNISKIGGRVAHVACIAIVFCIVAGDTGARVGESKRQLIERFGAVDFFDEPNMPYWHLRGHRGVTFTAWLDKTNKSVVEGIVSTRGELDSELMVQFVESQLETRENIEYIIPQETPFFVWDDVEIDIVGTYRIGLIPMFSEEDQIFVLVCADAKRVFAFDKRGLEIYVQGRVDL